MPESATLLLDAELSSLIDGEPVGNGIIFSLKTPEATFHYKETEFQHFFISLKHPRIVHGKTYYGGQVTTLHNAGAKIVSEVVDLHQALLRQVLFGSVHKTLIQELGILDAADVFVSCDELQDYHDRSRMLLEAPPLLRHTDTATALTDFGRAVDILAKFAEKLEDPEETRMLQAMCLFGKVQAELLRGSPAGDVLAQELQSQLVEKARSIQDNAKRQGLYDFFRAKGWEITYEELFPTVFTR
jgi:hypothetical protein